MSESPHPVRLCVCMHEKTLSLLHTYRASDWGLFIDRGGIND